MIVCHFMNRPTPLNFPLISFDLRSMTPDPLMTRPAYDPRNRGRNVEMVDVTFALSMSKWWMSPLHLCESRRLKGVGVRWTGSNAEAMTALEALQQSNAWATYWKSRLKAAA
jgi:hypothetical protein